MTDVVEILTHWYAGRSKSEVARSLGLHRETVCKYVAPAEVAGLLPGGEPISEEEWRRRAREWFPSLYDLKLVRPSWDSIALHHERIGELLSVVPMSVIHQRLVDESGLEASVASLRRYVRSHFSDKVRSGEVVLWRPPVDPGQEAQVDYGYLGSWLDPKSGRRRRVWAFSMVLSYSRHLFVYPVLTMDQAAWIDAHVAAFEFFSGCPCRIALDNLKAGVIKADIYDPKLNRAYAELADHYGVLLDPARAAHPKDKPRIEAVQKYIRTSLFAGRDFASLDEMVREAARWCTEVAGRRAPRALEGGSPLQVFGAEEAGALRALPVVPFELVTWSRPKVAPDAHVKVGKTLYSVPYKFIGKHLEARASAQMVQLYLDGEVVKTHPFQQSGRRTDWADLPTERAGFYMRTPVWCRAQAVLIGPATEALISELLALNVLYRLRQAQGVLGLVQKYGPERLEAACGRALAVGDPSYRTVRGILSAGTEHEPPEQTLPGLDLPGLLHGPEAFGSFLKERFLSRGAPRRGARYLQFPTLSRPDRARAPSPRRGQGRRSRRREALMPPTRVGACLGKVGGSAERHLVFRSGSGHEVPSPSPKRAPEGRAADAVACHSCAVTGMECCGHQQGGVNQRRGLAGEPGAMTRGDHAPCGVRSASRRLDGPRADGAVP
jgi:transposase